MNSEKRKEALGLIKAGTIGVLSLNQFMSFSIGLKNFSPKGLQEPAQQTLDGLSTFSITNTAMLALLGIAAIYYASRKSE